MLRKNTISVCTGPGCKAWDSNDLLSKLKKLSIELKKEVHIIESDCLNNCGGGVTIQLSISQEMIKVRNPDNLPDQIKKFLKSKVIEPSKPECGHDMNRVPPIIIAFSNRLLC